MPRIALLVVALIGLLVWMRYAAGRLAPRVAFAPVAFLATRKPVLATWALGALGWLALLVPTAIDKGHDSLGDMATLFAISLISGGGVAVMVVGPVFMLVRAFAAPPVFALKRGEEVVFAAPASHFRNGEARGGKLVVTNRRIGFRPHRFNVQLDVWSMRIDDLAEVKLEGSRLVVLRSRKQRPDAWLTVTGSGAALARRLGEIVVSDADAAVEPSPRTAEKSADEGE